MAEYVNLFDTLYGGAKWDIGVAINRSNALPLDRNSIFPSYELARAYAAMDEAAMSAELTRLGLVDVKINNNAYAGQVLAVVTELETIVYYIDANKQLQEVGGKVETDEKSIVLGEDGKLYIAGFKDASALTLPQKQADGSILWVPVSSIVQGDGNTVTEIAAADKSINVETKEFSDSSIKYDVKVNLSSEAGNQLLLKDDGLFIKVEGYDDSEIRNLINNKADTSVLANYYTKTEVDSAIDADVKVVGDKVATLEEQIKGLSGAMHFKGIKEVLPENTEGYDYGDVIIVGDKEYVCAENGWNLFGDVSAEGERLTNLEKAVNETIPANYALKSELPIIPTNVSAFNNDAGYITKDVNDLANYDTTIVIEGKIEEAISGLNISDYAKASYVDSKLDEKQNIISDLETIRSGAALGATALQTNDIADMLTKTEAQGIYATIEKVNGIDTRVGDIESKLPGINSSIESLNTSVGALPSYLNKKIDKVEFADIELPGIVAEGTGLEQIVKYQLPLISSKDVKEINVNKLVQTEGDELILNGGTASKTSA